MAVPYELPQNWIQYDIAAVVSELVEARASIKALTATPYQRDWVEKLQEIQLKMEVSGTSRIEGADFTEPELEAALDLNRPLEDLLTRSQRQARAAAATYQWIRKLPNDRPMDGELIREVHRRIVTGCDEDRCQPGQLRRKDENVTFGTPRHRGCEGGDLCQAAFDRLVDAIQHEFRGHDLLIQALALPYHFAAMHPFLDGNGRTARALEALMLQRAGLRDIAFIAMSNYYYDEKPRYLEMLALVRGNQYNLTRFLVFGLRGIVIQCNRLLAEVRKNMEKVLFRSTMNNLFGRLVSKRKRVIGERQVAILNVLLEVDQIGSMELIGRTITTYSDLKKSGSAFGEGCAGSAGAGSH